MIGLQEPFALYLIQAAPKELAVADLDAAFAALENLDEESRTAVELAGGIWLEMWQEAVARADKAEFLFGRVYAWAYQWALEFDLVAASELFDAHYKRPAPNQALLADRHARIADLRTRLNAALDGCKRAQKRALAAEHERDDLRAHRAEQARRTLAREPGRADSEFVFAAPHGGPSWPSDFDRIWRRFKTQQGLDIRFHDLRHTHATHLLRAGIHPKVVCERLGHASIGITLDTYSHVMPGMQEEEAERINAGPRAALAG